MHSARIITAHRAPKRLPIQVRAGEPVRLGEPDDQGPQFVWTVRADGLGGWIPHALFAVDADGVTATAQADYDTLELDADPDKRLTLHRELADWWWSENQHGVQGGVTARNIESIEGHAR